VELSKILLRELNVELILRLTLFVRHGIQLIFKQWRQSLILGGTDFAYEGREGFMLAPYSLNSPRV
jgi:hypothetical protein